MTRTVNIGNVEIKSPVVLAPMAGVTDRAYRELCAKFGSSLCFSEMVSSKALSFNSEKSEELMELSELERPCGIQLFGDDPECIAKAAELAMKKKPDLIDINMGCPAPKITSGGSGGALMKNPALCGKIVDAAVRAVSVPVTVKIRKGWDGSSVNAVEIAKICEQAGASAITVHGRTREQYYKPPADYGIIRDVKRSVSIPVAANGDINSPEKAKEVMELTGCDLIMLGRATLGSPWIFSEINSALNGVPFEPPPFDERLGIMLRHIERMVEYKGEYIALRQARKLIPCYLKGIRGAAELRNLAGRASTLGDLYAIAEKASKNAKLSF